MPDVNSNAYSLIVLMIFLSAYTTHLFLAVRRSTPDLDRSVASLVIGIGAVVSWILTTLAAIALL